MNNRIRKVSIACRIRKIFLFVAVVCSVFLLMPSAVKADTPSDEILDYEITVDVNADATLNLNYHIEWLVLDSDKYGPLDWANIGIPNSHVVSFEALSDNIDNININGSYAEVYFKESYYEGDIASFDFKIIQDNMYLAHHPVDGMCRYTFTPGWFDDIAVDNLVIRWKDENVDSFTPECLNRGGYLTWETTLKPGATYTVTTVYPGDAYGFNMDLTEVVEEDDDISGLELIGGLLMMVLGIVFLVVAFCAPFLAIFGLGYAISRGFSAATAQKKITRTKIVYYPECQGCGAVRKEGEKFCTYCGRSFIKSEEVIEEKDIPKEESAIKSKTRNGEYRYSSSPDTYIRVNVVNVPRPTSTRSYSRSGSSYSSSRSSSCAHSSCAHSSCACACACACAGGGRAGCTTKDFYNTALKMKYIEKVVNYRKGS